MRFAWLDDLLPEAMLPPRARILWVLFFALFPLAYVGGVLLELAKESPARIQDAVDRDACIRIAQQFALSKGYAVKSWSHYAIAETNDNVLAYYNQSNGAVHDQPAALVSARQIHVLFRSPDSAHDVRVFLSLTGKVIGYEIGKSTNGAKISSKVGVFQVNTTTTSDSGGTPAGPANPANDQAAEAIARRALATDTSLARMVSLGTPTISTTSDDPARTDVQWDASPPDLPALKLHIKVGVRDSQVVEQRIQTGVDKEHVAARHKLPIVLDVAYGFFLTFGAIYAIYRYAKRTLQKEVSHIRTLVVAVLFAASYGILVYSLAVDQLAVRINGEVFEKVLLVTSGLGLVAFFVLGLLVGIAYGSGEGEVREAYPGKLTSLDALLAGRLFSRDVAVSLLFGVAGAGWLLLLQHCLSYFLTPDLDASQGSVLLYTFARLPWLTLLLGKQYEALLIAVAGLLLPAAFLLRRTVRKKRHINWLLVCALFSVLRVAATYRTAAMAAVATIVLVSALLLPFFALDLLAAMVCLSALAFVNELATMTAIFPAWSSFAIFGTGLASAAVCVVAFLALNGPRVREEDVRPLYAKNLVERMSMQAEILAAREAQLRLLPQDLPEISGLHFAACCLPASGVGGDFYDFFRLDPNRVGIFVAQGGGQGLASALCIALAKGVLMHTSLQLRSPTQTLVELEASIAGLLHGGLARNISFAYAVLDARRNMLTYARLGTSPRFVIYRYGSGLTPSAQLERIVNSPGRQKNAPQIYEGLAHTQAGDHLVFFTQGVTSLHSSRFRKREFQWLDMLMRDLGQAEDTLQKSLFRALAKYQNQACEDLTAVIVRVVESHLSQREGVA